jgi:hypothetical protein
LLEGIRSGRSVTAMPGPAGAVRRLRTAPGYLGAVAGLKWSVMPSLFGLGGLAVLAFIALLTVGLPVVRGLIDAAETNGQLCRYAEPATKTDLFRTNLSCWNSGAAVTANERLRPHDYKVTLTVVEPWFDDTIPAGPNGYANADPPMLRGYIGRPFLRAIGGRWFQSFVTIISEHGAKSVQPLEFTEEGNTFVARLTPSQSGTVFVWVNDAVLPFYEAFNGRYGNNRGSASINISEIPQSSK